MTERIIRNDLLGEQRTHDVDLLRGERVDGDEQVRLADVGGALDLDGRRVPQDRLDVDVGRQRLDALGVVVDDRDLVGFCAKHLGQVGTDLTGSFNDYSHNTIFDSI